VRYQSNNMEKQYLYDGLTLIAQTNVIGNTIARYHYGDRYQLAENRNNVNSYFHVDSLGTNVVVTDVDGGILARYEYDAYGNLLTQTGNSEAPFGFTGYQKDEETGLYYANARYYDSNTGRFLREDPFDGDTQSPPSLHRYLYANANPTVFIDPTGKYGEEGHYYTTYFVALAVGYNADEARQLAVFSQFPDEVEASDAVALQTRAVGDTFLNSKRLRLSDVDSQYWTKGRVEQRERTSVQQSTHSLTGGDSELETQRAVKSVIGAKDLAITGVAIHRLGDTFSHRRIDDESKLYVTGDGHRKDGHKPDQIHLRPRLYGEYVSVLATTLAKKRGLSQKDAQNKIKRATDIGKVLLSTLGTVNPEKNKAVTPEDMKLLIRLADTENKFEDGTLVLDSPENHDIVEFGGFFVPGLFEIVTSRKINDSTSDIISWYESKFSIQDQGLNINGTNKLKDEVLKDMAVLIGIEDFRVLRSLDDDIVFDLIDQRFKHAVNENIRSYDNQLHLDKIDKNTSVIIE